MTTIFCKYNQSRDVSQLKGYIRSIKNEAQGVDENAARVQRRARPVITLLAEQIIRLDGSIKGAVSVMNASDLCEKLQDQKQLLGKQGASEDVEDEISILDEELKELKELPEIQDLRCELAQYQLSHGDISGDTESYVKIKLENSLREVDVSKKDLIQKLQDQLSVIRAYIAGARMFAFQRAQPLPRVNVASGGEKRVLYQMSSLRVSAQTPQILERGSKVSSKRVLAYSNLEMPEILSRVSKSATNFGCQLFAQLSGRDGKSCAISPISIIGALALGLEVIEDKVAYLEKLSLADMSVEDAHKGFAELLRASNLKDDNGLITISQAVATQSLDFVTPELSKIVKETYSGEIFTPTDSGSVCDVVNRWVSEKTQGNIRELLTDPRTEMALLNAIYLQLQWRSPFERPNGGWSKEPFTLGDGSIISDVPMMKQKGYFKVYETNGYSMLELPYKGPNGRQLSHLIFLPTLTSSRTPLEAVNHLQRLLTYEGIQDCRKRSISQKVRVLMPRTVQETDLDLLEMLKGIGFPLDKLISHLEDRNLKIEGIKHKTFVKTNELGSIAAAATSIHMVAKGMSLEKVINVNHPFVSCIMDGDNILFIGRVSDASALDLKDLSN